MTAHIEKLMPLSEPEGEISDCSSYEEYSEYSSSDSEEILLACESRTTTNTTSRRDSTASSASTSSNYRSWCQNKKRRGSINLKAADSRDAVITENRKDFWYWFKLALFVATPFIARQMGIIIGRRIMNRAFKPSISAIS